MKTIQSRTAAAFLIVAGTIAPAFAQDGGNRYGRGHERSDRPQERDFRGGSDRRGGGQEQSQARQEYRPQRQDNWQQQRYAPQTYAPQYRPQEYRRENNYRGGVSAYGFRPGEGARWSDRREDRGRFIPDDRFYRSFGRQHYFRVGRPVYYNGFPRFSYGGYGFQILDPVPAWWGNNWYDSDDVYVDYDGDAYYMYNRRYPGAGIAVSIEF